MEAIIKIFRGVTLKTGVPLAVALALLSGRFCCEWSAPMSLLLAPLYGLALFYLTFLPLPRPVPYPRIDTSQVFRTLQSGREPLPFVKADWTWWVKLPIISLILKIQRHKPARESDEDWEMAKPLLDDKDAIESFFMSAYSKTASVLFRIARRHQNKAEFMIVMQIPELGIVMHPQHPEVMTTRPDKVDDNSIVAGCGMRFKCLEPMRRWAITFDGRIKVVDSRLKDVANGEEFPCKFDLEWTRTGDPFDFDRGIDLRNLASGLASMPWGSDFFALLKNSKQVHMEQFGKITGPVTVTLGPKRTIVHNFDVEGMRDHSFGIRDWSFIKRYHMDYFLTTKGDMTSSATVDTETMPNFVSGFLHSKGGDKHVVEATTNDLRVLGVDGNLPKHYEFALFSRSRWHRVTCDLIYPAELRYNGRAVIYEGIAKYNLDGVEGFGISEWGYRMPGYTWQPPVAASKRS